MVKQFYTDILAIGKALVESPVIAAADCTLTVKITRGDTVVDDICTAAYVHVMLNNGGILVEDGVYPICSLAKRIGIVEGGHLAGIEATFIHDNGIFCSIQDSWFAPRVLNTVGKVVGNLGLTLLTLLSGN